MSSTRTESLRPAATGPDRGFNSPQKTSLHTLAQILHNKHTHMTIPARKKHMFFAGKSSIERWIRSPSDVASLQAALSAKIVVTVVSSRGADRQKWVSGSVNQAVRGTIEEGGLAEAADLA